MQDPSRIQRPQDWGTLEREADVEISATMEQKILTVLKARTGIDFSRYKTSTVCRQVQRRMALLKLADLNSYLSMLETDDQEAELLKGNLLVGVTRFFREASTFASLPAALEARITHRPVGQPLRVWVPGCSSGEEADSIAMVISAALGHPAELHEHLKIFATDLNETALAVARRGVYPLASTEAVPAALKERFCRPPWCWTTTST